MNRDLLLAHLQKLSADRHPNPVAAPSPKGFMSGLETRAPSDSYRWDGLRRGGDPAHPFVVMQFTLTGRGRYQEFGITHRLEPGTMFAAIVPEPHVYDLPPDSQAWTFFYFVIFHPYVVQRMMQTKASTASVLSVPSESLFLARAARLFEEHGQGFRDEWAMESALFEFLMEYERFCHHLRYAPNEREQLLTDVRRETMATLHLPPDVTRLARARGMSRSQFSHAFKTATGISPAQFVARVRLEEVTRRLLTSNQTLDSIAAEIGYSDANHLCKVFRRHYHLSPGAFRRQMR